MNRPSMTLPLVSIVLTTYNGSRFLSEQLDSLINQSYQNIEIIAVDDRSTDNTIQILQQYAAKYPCIKVFANETNLGFVKNFQRGGELSSGAFIAFCDQDDYWDKEKVSNLVHAIGNHPLIHSDSHICNERLEKTGKRLSDSVHYLDLHSPLQQAVFCRIYGNTMLFTRELFNRATPFLEIIPHDWWLSYNATLCGGVKYLGEPLVYYRQHSSNIYGAIGTRDKKKEKNSSRIEEKNTHFSRMQKFYEICPETMNREKRVLSKLTRSYRNLSFANNCLRMVTFFGNYKLLLVVKKRSQLRNYLFCLKTFFKTI